jgi:HPt (histidine-containing phosphotransfer) domain-containing protein
MMAKLAQRIVYKTMQTMGAGNVSSACVLLKIFFQELRAASENLKNLSVKKESKNIAMAAHKMAGACAYFGAEKLYTQLLKLESLAKHALSEKDFMASLVQVIQLLDKTSALESEVFKLLETDG